MEFLQSIANAASELRMGKLVQPIRAAIPPRQKKQQSAPAETKQQVDQESAEQAAQELTKQFDVKVEMSHDEKTGRGVVRIFSPDGQRLLRQMPPEEVVALADKARRGSLMGLLTSHV